MPEWLYGRHAVEEALRAGRRKVFRLLLSESGAGREGRQGHDDRLASIEEIARRAGAQIERVPSARLDALTKVGHHHQGVAAEVAPFQYATLAETVQLCREAGSKALVLVLEFVAGPAELRHTAEVVGGCGRYGYRYAGPATGRSYAGSSERIGGRCRAPSSLSRQQPAARYPGAPGSRALGIRPASRAWRDTLYSG